MALEREIETYDRLLPELMAEDGKHVVIVGDKVLGIFVDRNEALERGYATAAGSFLCRQILAEQPVIFLPTMFRVAEDGVTGG